MGEWEREGLAQETRILSIMRANPCWYSAYGPVHFSFSRSGDGEYSVVCLRANSLLLYNIYASCLHASRFFLLSSPFRYILSKYSVYFALWSVFIACARLESEITPTSTVHQGHIKAIDFAKWCKWYLLVHGLYHLGFWQDTYGP